MNNCYHIWFKSIFKLNRNNASIYFYNANEKNWDHLNTFLLQVLTNVIIIDEGIHSFFAFSIGLYVVANVNLTP